MSSSFSEDGIKNLFKDNMSAELSVAVAAIKTLLEIIKREKTTTMYGLSEQLKNAVEVLKSDCSGDVSEASITSGSELFMRFISNIRDERRDDDFEECRKLMIDRGGRFVNKVLTSRQKIARLGAPHIKEHANILVHSHSRVVLEILSKAFAMNKRFTVLVTESSPDKSGKRMVKELLSKGIRCQCIMDAAVGYHMEQVDLVLVGAEGVLASGGIINKVGTLSIAMVAKVYNKPFYVAAESFKFSNRYPLNQADLEKLYPQTHTPSASSETDASEPAMLKIDYTPAEYITLLFTDIGILTPTAVSDELIKLT